MKVVALALILFYGGLDTNWQSVRPLLKYGVTLSTLGVFLTALILGVFAKILLGLTFLEGLLLGAIVSSTDAAAVFSILRARGISLKPPLKPLLELGLPVGVLIALMARGEEFLVPGGGTTILAGDTLLVLASKENFARVQSQINAKE